MRPSEEGLDLRDYLDLAPRSGFPEALDITGTAARQRWLDGYVSQIITRDPTGTVGARNPVLLLRYLEAYALHSAGIVEAKSINEAAGVDKRTGASYEQVLENVFIVESLPAWKTNRLKRLVQSPKRYILDAGLMAAILRVDQAAIFHDGKLLGRVIDTFVASQLRGEIEVCATRPRLYHLPDTDGRHEADIVAELGGERILAFEVKASSSVAAHDARHLAWLRDEHGDRFIAGVVFHTGRGHSPSATGSWPSRSAPSGLRYRPTSRRRQLSSHRGISSPRRIVLDSLGAVRSEGT